MGEFSNGQLDVAAGRSKRANTTSELGRMREDYVAFNIWFNEVLWTRRSSAVTLEGSNL